MSDYSGIITFKGSNEDYEKIIAVFDEWKNKERTVYINSFEVSYKELKTGTKLVVEVDGPYGCFAMLEEVKLFEDIAEAVPDISFNGKISGWGPGGDEEMKCNKKKKGIPLYDIRYPGEEEELW